MSTMDTGLEAHALPKPPLWLVILLFPLPGIAVLSLRAEPPKDCALFTMDMSAIGGCDWIPLDSPH